MYLWVWFHQDLSLTPKKLWYKSYFAAQLTPFKSYGLLQKSQNLLFVTPTNIFKYELQIQIELFGGQ